MYLQIASSDVIKGDGELLSLVWENGSGRASLHGFLLVHFLQLLRSYALVLFLADANSTILKVLEENFASVRVKTALEQEALDALINPTIKRNQVSRNIGKQSRQCLSYSRIGRALLMRISYASLEGWESTYKS